MTPLNLRRNVAFAIGEFALNIALVFFSYRLVIAHGGLEALGLWATLFAWASLIRLGDLGLAHATLRFVALRDPIAQRHAIARHAHTAILANFALFVVLTGLGYLAMRALLPAMMGAANAAAGQPILPWLFGGLLLFNLANTVLAALQGLHLGFQRSLLSVGGTLLQLLAVAVLVPRHGLVGLAIAQCLQYATVGIVGWLLLRRAIGISFAGFDPPALRAMLGYSLRSQFADLANSLFEPLSKILLAQFAGLATQGLYELAYKAVALSRNAVVAGVTATLPALTSLATAHPLQVRPLYRQAIRRTTIAIILLALALVIAAPTIATLWTGASSPQFSLFVALLAAGFALNTIGAPAYNLGLATGTLRHNMRTASAALAGLALLGWIAGIALGPNGIVAVVALCLAASGLAIRRLNERLLPAPGLGVPA